MAKKKTTAVGKTAAAAKTAAPTRQKLQQEITSLRHKLSSSKHSDSRKSATKKSAKHSAAKRTWSPDSEVGICSARAVAEALRIAAGLRLDDRDLLALHVAAGGDLDTGTSILAALEALETPVALSPVPAVLTCCAFSACPRALAHRPDHHRLYDAVQASQQNTSLILGLDLPYGEPHAVTVDQDGTWWSWGEPHSPDDFPGAVIEEAWAVTPC